MAGTHELDATCLDAPTTAIQHLGVALLPMTKCSADRRAHSLSLGLMRESSHPSAGRCWLIQALRPSPNPLRRSLDKVLATILAAFMLLGLLGAPGSVWLGQYVRTHLEGAAAASAAHGRWTSAVVLREPQMRTVSLGDQAQAVSWWAEVAWVGEDAHVHTATNHVSGTVHAGASLPVWTDSGERLTSPPDSPNTIMFNAVGAGAFVFLGWVALCGVLAALAHLIGTVFAHRAWHREWEIVGPQWRRFHH